MHLLRTKASKHAIYGVVIALLAIVLATLAVAFVQSSALTLETIVAAQKNNAALWILDGMPFIFAFWGQYVSSMMAYEASAMLVDQTTDLRAHTVALEAQATRNATHDQLTGLPNRFLYSDRLAQAIIMAASEKSNVAVIIMDIDRFKEINEAMGPYQGDRLLKQVATRLQNTFHDPETVARLGGDEFAAIIPRLAQLKETSQVIRKIEKALEAPFMLEGLKIDVRASMGVSFYPQHGTDADTLLQRADVAMYAAKRNRAGFLVYSPRYDEYSPQRLTLMGELRHAIENEGLVLHFQPKVDLKSGSIAETEALVRWAHPKHGLMLPDEFIPLAERTGLIKPLTLWVLNKALKQCGVWEREGLQLGVAVNLSAQALFDLELPDIVTGALAAHDVSPKRLILEITESMLMVDKERALQILERLSGMGVRIAIDDFGTGYSSLSYLSKMPVDEIKIDKSFVLDMHENKSNAVIVHATIELGHNLGLSVIGEGVESAESMARLHALGCDAAQGYYMTKPLDAGDLSAWFESQRSSGLLRIEAGDIRLISGMPQAQDV
ncbi:MAG: putative bifunctional diguanylate cyclase/phosphodiesterase [Burkholderiales bacterium]